MMETVRDWIISIVSVTMLLSAAQMLIPEGGIRRTFSFSGGLVLTMVLLQPILGSAGEASTLRPEGWEEQIRERQEELEQSACAEWEMLIEEEIAAYILDRANALGLEISAEVWAETGTDGLPVLGAELAGEPSEALADYLSEELGIPRERQVWEHERNS